MKGIYLIENLINGHKYVGRSVNIKNRWGQHLREVNKGGGYSIHAALRKYGIENFSFKVLEEVKDSKDLYDREIYWYYKLNPEYNEIPPDKPNNMHQSTSVFSMDKDTGEIVQYVSVREAARQNNISKTAILNVLKKIRNSANNKYWSHTSEFDIPIDRGNDGLRRKKVLLSNEHEQLYFDSVSEAARYCGAKGAAQINFCFKRGYKFRGYTVTYIEPVETIPLIGK